MKKALILICILLTYQVAASAQEPVLLGAMNDELLRSMDQLKLGDNPGPYYVSYLVKDVYSLRIRSDSGAITTNTENRRRTLKTDLRVGNYTLDNSNFAGLSASTSLLASTNAMLAVDDNYDVLRRQIWLATDKAYKSALATIAKKKASLQNTVRTEALPDFTKGGANSRIISEIPPAVERDRWTQLVDELSKLFLNQEHIQRSKVDLRVQIVNSYYINSEGAKSVEPAASTLLVVAAYTQADDGMPLGDYLTYTALHPKELPDRMRLNGDIKAMIDNLSASRAAPIAEDYSGPVLFAGQAAGELFAQGLSRFLLGRKMPFSDNPQMNNMIGRMMENPFLGEVDRRVASRFLSMNASPGLRNYNGKSLLGSYEIDEEGVPAGDIPLIENGILKNLLTTRAPVAGFPQSNGHSRGGSPVPSVIRITSTDKYTAEELKQELLKVVKDENLPYGYIVKGLTPPAQAAEMEGSDVVARALVQQPGPPEPTQFRLSRPYAAFRVYPDGREELVRGVEFRSLNIRALRDILATSDEEIVYDYPVSAANISSGSLSGILSLLGSSGISGQEYYATVITPALLLEEVDMKTSTGNYQKLPIVAYPLK